MAYVKIGTGIGGGLILNGRIYRGHRGSAGELGHLTIDENGPRCVCGGRGCLETLAGARAIVADAEQGLSLARKRAALPGDESALSQGAQRVFADITDVTAAAQKGDAACIAALERAGERIALALAGLVNLVNPASIILDGGVAHAGEILLNSIRRVVSSSSLPAAWKGTRLLLGELGSTAIALGAALTVLDAAFDPHIHALSASSPGVDAGVVVIAQVRGRSDTPILFK